MKLIPNYIINILNRIDLTIRRINPFRDYFGDKTQNTLDHTLRQTVQCENELTIASQEFESRFIEVLETLETLRQSSESLCSESNQILELSKSDKNPILSVSNSLIPFLEFVKDSVSTYRDLVQELKLNEAGIAGSLSHESNLDQTFSQLSYIHTLFGIESATLDQNDKLMFTSLVKEIHRLQTEVSAIFSEQFSFLRKHKVRIANLSSLVEKQSILQLNVFNEKEIEMKESIRSQKLILDKSIESNTQLNATSQSIANAIGQAIISLQTQDIISQKIQHVFEISEEMRNRFGNIEKLSEKHARCTELRFIENASTVVNNQIQSIKSELKSADRQINSSFETISIAIADIDHSKSLSFPVDEKKENQHENGHALLKSLSDIKDIISYTENFSKMAFDEIAPMRGMASNVTETIVNLSEQLHLIGLNAEIHSARTMNRNSLEVLSARTSSISIETKQLCGSVSKSLDTLIETLNNSVNKFESLYNFAVNNDSLIKKEEIDQFENLNTYEERYSEASHTTAKQINQLKEIIQSRRSSLQLSDSLLLTLESMQQLQTTISMQSKKEADSLGVEVDIPKIMEPLLDRYTMNSEKSVHMKSLGISMPEENSNWQTHSNVPDNNTEFFSMEAEDPLSDQDNLQATEFFESVDRREEPAEFGENVELF